MSAGCRGCFSRDEEIARLKSEVERLKGERDRLEQSNRIIDKARCELMAENDRVWAEQDTLKTAWKDTAFHLQGERDRLKAERDGLLDAANELELEHDALLSRLVRVTEASKALLTDRHGENWTRFVEVLQEAEGEE
jgi:hypothetical protein